MKTSLVQYKSEQLGSVILSEVKCGKANCHCASGTRHTAYYHYFYIKQADGSTKQRKKYISKSEAKKLKQVIQYRRNKINAFDFISKITGEFLLLANDNFSLLSDVYKRLHIILKKAGLNSFSNKRIQELMIDAPRLYQEKPFGELAS